MVMRKKLDYGSNGFQVHSIPRAPRSFRRRSPQKKMVEDNQICAFELLASLAGKLLQESESSSTSSNASERKDQLATGKNVIKQEQGEVKPVKVEYIEQATGEQIVLASELASQDSKVQVASPDYAESCIVDIGNGIGSQKNAEGEGHGDVTMAHVCSLKVPVDLCEKHPDLVNSNSDAKLPLCMDPAPSSLFALHRNSVSLGNRDDDETFSRYIKPLGKVRSSRPPSRIGDQRIRKLLTSKYWKVAPKLKDCEMSRTDGGMKSAYRKRKTFYNREKYQHDKRYKRRKLYDQSSVLTSDCGFSSESVSNSPEKLVNGEKNGSATTNHGASSKAIGHQTPFCHKDSHVKLSIKSFKVPELFIEVPETTTVGSLKRTVMEAVTAILGGGLRVGVVLQGKKVRDNNRTLLQSGISCTDNLDSLGFTLEPTVMQAPPLILPETPSFPSLCDAPPIATRSLPVGEIDLEVSGALPDPNSLAILEDQLESSQETISCHTDILTDNSTLSDSRALVPVPVPAMNMEAPLAVIPLNQKPRRSELVQRRTRRPFSVTEVEALVEAVEQVGTGRWRDVKLRSFEDADHRTYVDLKDKWKTLVHTAQIAPQQRRGEPVPQELLDRVLAAHGYWSQHQAKHQHQHQGGVEKITDRVGAENVAPTV